MLRQFSASLLLATLASASVVSRQDTRYVGAMTVAYECMYIHLLFFFTVAPSSILSHPHVNRRCRTC